MIRFYETLPKEPPDMHFFLLLYRIRFFAVVRLAIICFISGFCAVSAAMAQILKTNYANFYQCNIPPLENLRLSIQNVLGYWPTQILYILIVSALTVLFTILSYLVYKSLRRLTASKEERTPQEVL